MSTSSRPASPWSRQVHVVHVGFVLAGAVLFILGTGMVRNETVYDDQVPGINLAIVGAVVANAAGVLLLLAGRRSVAARRVAVLGAVPPAQDQRLSITAPASSAHLVGGEGLTHFHRADCTMAAGRNWPEFDRSAHERAGRIACGVCKP